MRRHSLFCSLPNIRICLCEKKIASVSVRQTARHSETNTLLSVFNEGQRQTDEWDKSYSIRLSVNSHDETNTLVSVFNKGQR